MNTLDFILKKYRLRLQPDTDHRDNQQRMPIEIHGMTREALAGLFAELGFKSGAEIGVEQGEYSEVLARANPEAKLYLVDAWQAYKGYRDHVSQEKLDGFYKATQERMQGHRHVIHREFSNVAALSFDAGSLDWVFIDANHSFDFVIKDIITWSEVVRPGGLVCGHDYFVGKDNQQHQVPIAVRAYTEAHNIRPWFVCRGDHSPSWFFVKP